MHCECYPKHLVQLTDQASSSLAKIDLAIFGHTFKLFWSRTCPNRREMDVEFTGTNFQAESSILDPFGTIFDVLGPT